MKRLAILAALLIALPTSAAPVSHRGDRIRTELVGFEEVPSVSTVALGMFEARVAPNDSFFDYTLTYNGLQGQVRQAHIHFAQAAVNGPIVIWLCGTSFNPGPAGTPTCPQSGTVTGTIRVENVLASPTTQQLAQGEIEEIIAAMRGGAAYVNVHSDISPGGEIRGQFGGRAVVVPHNH
jgi:hypothetical protein